MTNGLIMI